ncbi:hypothetical protein KAR91_30135 [Candidatus Pacearchaeota archaeon]|nr:hypothetical protein [Candidatus Pacearchaeota archaeon]
MIVKDPMYEYYEEYRKLSQIKIAAEDVVEAYEKYRYTRLKSAVEKLELTITHIPVAI